MCGNISMDGTVIGKARNVGRSKVNVGMIKIRFELCGWKNVVMSLVFSIMIIDARNTIHSIVMVIGLVMFTSIP